ncbi:MAG: alpha/beta fold hydrolase [Pirellulales bacterium]|nr:alpha/beta fold hydrolase [Pirellulales bacterium]
MLALPESWPEFRTPWLLRNQHVQTILSAWLPSGRHVLPTQLHEVSLSDGDQLALHDDAPSGWKQGDAAALLIHGLAGCHGSPYMIRLARKLAERGVRCLRLDLRGAGAGALLATKSYHCGCGEDIAVAASAVRRLIADSPLLAVGFSLGGNALLKMLGEANTHGQLLPDAAMAVCPPLDMLRCSDMLSRGFNRIYDWCFTSVLYKRLRYRAQHREDINLGFARRPRTLREFDDVYTAPLWGFASVEDYYLRAAARNVVDQISVPTLILTAADDPMIPADAFHELPQSPHVRVMIVPAGGHTGFVSHRKRDQDRHWLEWRIVELATGLAELRG